MFFDRIAWPRSSIGPRRPHRCLIRVARPR
jgi:hypothetical protein